MLKTPLWLKLLATPRMLLILLLGFFSGLPLGLTGTTLQTWYAMDGLDMVTIGFLSLAGTPYTYKFLWAPLLDKYQPPLLTLRRGWMLLMQLALTLTLVSMAFLKPSINPMLLVSLAFMVALLSATQDIAIDAYRTELLTIEERGMGTSMAVSGYRIAMLVSGGLTLIIAHHMGFKITYLLMAALMSIAMVVTFIAKEPTHYRAPPANFFKACVDPFKEFLTRPNAILLLVFIMVYKLGDVFANGLTTVFLLKGVGFSLLDIGKTIKTVGLVGTLLGAFMGGVMMVRLGLFRSLLLFGIVQAITNLLYLALYMVGPQYNVMVGTLFLDNFGGGLGTASFMALIMSLCKAPYTATQFALLSAITAIGRVWVGPIAGYLVELVGWGEFFIWTVIFAIPGLLLLLFLRKTIQSYETPTAILENNNNKSSVVVRV